ncbi:hypothetical protein Goklo_023914 [Gossypium klotzschianum]|uniref:Uncharacterized protein n=1 Tax=Gossypium klotzschianum TaxID=34286 RepID=A0A7J8W5K7_9ROSI|nr:hypothetical protein [Gossypium klotzschianum]
MRLWLIITGRWIMMRVVMTI